MNMVKSGHINERAMGSRSGWGLLPFGQLGKWRGGGTSSKEKSHYWENGTIPWVSPKHMKSEIIDRAIDSITPVAVQESSTNVILAGSVLVVTRSGILEHSLPVGSCQWMRLSTRTSKP